MRQVTRDGFRYVDGRFVTMHPYSQERWDASQLKAMFLPGLTPEAQKMIHRDRDFVESQLQHYGIVYEQNDWTGNGVLTLKKALKAGECDRVPEHIETLRKEMHAEWLSMLDSLESNSHDKRGSDSWKRNAEPELGSTSSHATPTHGTVPDDKSNPVLIEGKYEVKCSKISKMWDVGELSLGIQKTKLPGILQADFDFGVLDGLMMLSTEKEALAYFCEGDDFGDAVTETESGGDNDSKSEDDGNDYDDGTGDDEKQDENHYDPYDFDLFQLPIISTERKRKRSRSDRSKPAKAAKTLSDDVGEGTKYFLCLKSTDTGTGEIHPTPEKGSVTFYPDGSFVGTMSLDVVDRRVPFSGRKISDTPSKSQARWEDYSWAAYESARIGRWG